MLKEQGMKILKDTGCRIGAHVFSYTDGGYTNTSMPEYHLCHCGRYTYKEYVAELEAKP